MFQSGQAEAAVSKSAGAVLEPGGWDLALARSLLQRAQGMFQKWPEGFVGFSAVIRCREGERVVTGEVRVLAGGCVETTLPCPELRTWAESALRAIARARTPRFFKHGDGRFPIIFGPDDGHPLGRPVLVHLDDGAYRTYRIDARVRLRQEEQLTFTTRVTTTYDDFVRTCPGRMVPRRTRILDWDLTTRTPLQTAEVEDEHCRVDHVWLPARRHMVLAAGDARRVLSLDLEDHVVL